MHRNVESFMKTSQRSSDLKCKLLWKSDDFSLFVRHWASNTEEDAAQSYPMGLSGETVGSDLLKSDSVKSRLLWLKYKVCYVHLS